MPVVAGRILEPLRVVEGWLHTEQGRIVAHGRGEPPEEPVATGWIIPSPVDAHTHVGDAFLRDKPGKPRNVKELVGPGGWKHTHLANADPAVQTQAIGEHLSLMAQRGVAAHVDFREGGVGGARTLRGVDAGVQSIIHGRPRTPEWDEDEAERLFMVVDGLGLSGLRDIKTRDLERWAEAARDARRPIGIHVSEDKRDDIDAAIALEPSYVVHMTQGKTSDFDALADERIPIVVCPRSNAFFGMKPPVAEMLESGCRVALGTDNAMFHEPDLLAEGSLIDEVSVEDRFRMMSYTGRLVAGIADAKLERGAPADWIVVPDPPFANVRRKPGFEPDVPKGGRA